MQETLEMVAKSSPDIHTQQVCADVEGSRIRSQGLALALPSQQLGTSQGVPDNRCFVPTLTRNACADAYAVDISSQPNRLTAESVCFCNQKCSIM